MFIRTFFLCTFLLVLVECENDSVRIQLNIDLKQMTAYCDHTKERIKEHKYIALEGGEINIETKYKHLINNLTCVDLSDASKVFINDPEPTKRHNVTVNVTKEMSTIWYCTVLLHKHNLNTRPLVKVGNETYTAAYCYMQVHVRRLTSPQTILVNNMVLEQVRTDLSEQQVDYTVEYEYADSDLIDITCAAFNILEPFRITMQLENFSNNITSPKIVSNYFTSYRAKFHSRYNNSQIFCRFEKEKNDETRVRITLIMRSEFKRIVNLKINDTILRPKLKQNNNNYYVNYKCAPNQRAYVFCHIPRGDMKLYAEVNDSIFWNKLIANDSTYSIEVSPKETSTVIRCSADYVHNKTGAEITQINIIPEIGFLDKCPLYMNLPSNGIVLELRESYNHQYIYYEFEEGDLLTFTCYTTCNRVIYLTFQNSGSAKNKNDKNISLTLDLSRQEGMLEKTCFMIEKPERPNKRETTVKRVTVYFRKATFIPTTSVAPITVPPGLSTPQQPLENTQENDGSNLVIIAASGVTLIVVLSVAIIIYKMRARNHLQRGPNDRHYENLQNQSTTSIPAYPVQWESNYAVPVDQRVDNETYSVPVKPDTMYATPIPKNKRKKQQEDPTYASLDLHPSASDHRNILKHTQDSNYAEVCSKLEDCYAKVLPKNKRNVKNESHYANVANENQYANTIGAEPMYCEPNSTLQSQRAEYANVNNGLYANRPAQDYVEPTYCEPHIRK